MSYVFQKLFLSSDQFINSRPPHLFFNWDYIHDVPIFNTVGSSNVGKILKKPESFFLLFFYR